MTSESDSDDVQVLSLTERLRRDGCSAPSVKGTAHRQKSSVNIQKKKRSQRREVSIGGKAKRRCKEESEDEQCVSVLQISSEMLKDKKAAAISARRAVCNANTVKLAQLLFRLFSSSSVKTVCDPKPRNIYPHPNPPHTCDINRPRNFWCLLLCQHHSENN